jgi:hypothetical protein
MNQNDLGYYELELRNCLSAIEFGFSISVTYFESLEPKKYLIATMCLDLLKVLLEKKCFISNESLQIECMGLKSRLDEVIPKKELNSVLMNNCACFFTKCLKQLSH